MKAWLWLVAAGAMVSSALRPDEPSKLILSGNYQGMLTPCGCTRPMSGGIRRLATFVSQARGADWVDVGGWVNGARPEDILKAETVAEALGKVGVKGAVLTASESGLGESEVSNLESAMGAQWITPRSPLLTDAFFVGGSGVQGNAESEQEAIRNWLPRRPAELVSVWVSRLGLEQARTLEGPDVVVYRSEGSPPLEAERQGKMWLVSVGSRGKFAVELTTRAGQVNRYRRVELTEEFPDEPRASKSFQTYLDRVGAARLIERLPRSPGAEFAGTQTCGSCHASSLQKWKESGHAHALATLEELREDRDPDCLPCHVVGLASINGFKDRKTTPSLSDVGCEACHGPGAAHAARPMQSRMAKVGLEPCTACHNADNSPGFDAQRAWPHISHGDVEKISTPFPRG